MAFLCVGWKCNMSLVWMVKWVNACVSMFSAVDIYCIQQLSAVTADEYVVLYVIGCQETSLLVWQPGWIPKPHFHMLLLIAWCINKLFEILTLYFQYETWLGNVVIVIDWLSSLKFVKISKFYEIVKICQNSFCRIASNCIVYEFTQH